MATKINIQPLGKRVLVKPDEVEEKTSGGLYVPSTVTEDKKSESGVVVMLGTGENVDVVKGKECKYEFSFKEGDKVLFKKYSPEEVEFEGDKYYILDADDILAVIK